MTGDLLPLRYEGNGVFRCLRPKRVTIAAGEVHPWQMMEERSAASHRHFFAMINEAWKNLPEDMMDELPSPEHLRKWALIKAGFCTKTQVVCANNSEAIRLMATAKALDKYSIAALSGKTVTIWTADSQRRDAMSRKEFQEAKERAIHIISELIGTDAATLGKMAA